MSCDRKRQPETLNSKMGIWGVFTGAAQIAATQRHGWFVRLLSSLCDNAAHTFPLNLKLEKAANDVLKRKNTAVTSFLYCFELGSPPSSFL